MDRIPVKANKIVAVGYDAAMHVLEVEFNLNFRDSYLCSRVS